MIWKPCKLFAKVPDDDKVDELGNPIMKEQEIWSGGVRFTPWSDVDLELEGREVVKNEQLYAVPIDVSRIRNAKTAELDGIRLNIKEVSDLSPRWTRIRVEIYKHGQV